MYESGMNLCPIKRNPLVEEAIGSVTGFGPFPAGRIQILEGAGEAELILAVEGTEGIVRAVVRLEKPQGEHWSVSSVQLE